MTTSTAASSALPGCGVCAVYSRSDGERTNKQGRRASSRLARNRPMYVWHSKYISGTTTWYFAYDTHEVRTSLKYLFIVILG